MNYPLKIDCALEAKCYASDTAVRVRQMSRLISRIRYRQFGIMITTSYVDGQAYKEMVEDGHPILIVTASDIAEYFEVMPLILLILTIGFVQLIVQTIV